MRTTNPWKAVVLAVLCWSLLSRVTGFVTPISRQGHTKLPQHLQFDVPRAPGTCSGTPTYFFMVNAEDADEQGDSSTEGEVVEEEKNILQKFNDFLDTPILDANNRSNEGPVKEMLKEFSRDEPELAQLSFSVVVIGTLLVITKLITG